MKRFTLRDLFWLVLVAAILVTWWVDHSRQAAEIEKMREPTIGTVRDELLLDDLPVIEIPKEP